MAAPNIDFNHPQFRAIAAWASGRIDELRRKNDGELSPIDTATVRGQLKVFKELLALPEAAARAESVTSAPRSRDAGPLGGY